MIYGSPLYIYIYRERERERGEGEKKDWKSQWYKQAEGTWNKESTHTSIYTQVHTHRRTKRKSHLDRKEGGYERQRQWEI